MAVEAGLCLECRHGRRIRGARSIFWLCERSRIDPRFPRYPRLPVRRCAGYEPQTVSRARPEERDRLLVGARDGGPNQPGHGTPLPSPGGERLVPEAAIRQQEVEAVPVEPDLMERIRRVLRPLPGVQERRMVGGRCFLVDGRMCCGVFGQALMVGLDPEEKKRALSLPYVRPMRLGARELAPFVLMDPSAVASDDVLRSWLARAVRRLTGSFPALPSAPASPKERFAQIVSQMEGREGVVLGAGKGRFGSGTLQVNGRIFAMEVRGELVLKLPATRVAELVSQDAGRHFEARRDRPMREWLVVAVDYPGWQELAVEAREFVARD